MATPAQLRHVEKLCRALSRPATGAQLEAVVLAAADADLANVSEAALEALERVWIAEAKQAEAEERATKVPAEEPTTPEVETPDAAATPALTLVAGDAKEVAL